jgi:hypothetical protein
MESNPNGVFSLFYITFQQIQLFRTLLSLSAALGFYDRSIDRITFADFRVESHGIMQG